MNTTPLTTSSHFHPDVGDKFEDHVGEARVMAIADGWAMLRRPNAVPFTIDCNDLMALPRWRLRCDLCEKPRVEKKG